MKPLRKSALSKAWRAFVRHCERVHYGALENVEFFMGEPAGSATTVKTVAFGGKKDNGPTPHFGDPEAVLSDAWRELIKLASTRPHLCIRRLDVANGAPLRGYVAEEVEVAMGSATNAAIGRDVRREEAPR